MSSKTLSPLLGGVAGEYFVAAELSARGYIASITLRNTKGVDILCSNEDASKTIGIQVKTNKSSKRSWVLNQKSEDYFADNLYYIFVNLNDNNKPPDYFIVSSEHVAKHIKKTHREWLDTPGKNGNKHNDNTLRKFTDEKEEFLNRCLLLGITYIRWWLITEIC
ncbi:MAG: hypothetical protein WCO19_03820 [Candidatus Saccharibacteria bacterium]